MRTSFWCVKFTFHALILLTADLLVVSYLERIATIVILDAILPKTALNPVLKWKWNTHFKYCDITGGDCISWARQWTSQLGSTVKKRKNILSEQMTSSRSFFFFNGIPETVAKTGLKELERLERMTLRNLIPHSRRYSTTTGSIVQQTSRQKYQ